ncbi:nitroreductase [Desulfitobacterium hafniense DCB-2]|uniref:Nitroreductase n=1 Tax=Desulfitobacterium hafniense (strain DSM 10664 / DCB-2) TaxID=272564 RepID=B8FS50_DESHD|nr:nitroreductase [Desulfitobacterium hafniense DCB-2]
MIFVSHRKQNLQPGIEFANVTCIAYSMHLAAACLGLGSVFIWGSLEAMREIPELDNTAVLNLPDDFEPLLGIAIGHPEQKFKARDLRTDKLAINYL